MGDTLANLSKAAFIDRDGVLNKLVDRGPNFTLSNGKKERFTAPFTHAELELLPDVAEALELMKQKGYLRIVVTNQPDVGLGHITPVEFARITDVFMALPIDAVFACTHVPNAGCHCRKPRPGMLFRGAAAFNADLPLSAMMGDNETDVEAGRAAGVGQTIRLMSDHTVATAADVRVHNVLEAARALR